MTYESQYSDATLSSMQRMFGRGFLSPGGEAEVPLIVAGLDLAGRRVLDWGCGLGGPTIVLARDCGAGRVLGIDVEAGNLAAARANAAAAGLAARISFQLVAPGPLPFAAASFDLVFTSAALCHLPLADKEAVFADIHRVLAPGGHFAGSDWMTGKEAGFSRAFDDWTEDLRANDLRFIFGSLAFHRTALAAAGFADVALSDRSAETLADARAILDDSLGAGRGVLLGDLGPERYAGLVRRNRARVEALANGDLRRCHFRARKPA